MLILWRVNYFLLGSQKNVTKNPELRGIQLPVALGSGEKTLRPRDVSIGSLLRLGIFNDQALESAGTWWSDSFRG